MKFDGYLKTLLDRISLRQFLITILFILVTVEISIFAFFTYKTIYSSIYQERIAKIKYIDDFIVDLLKYENSFVQKKEKTLEQAKSDIIKVLKLINLYKTENYIWIDGYNGVTYYHPIKNYSRSLSVDTEILKIVNSKGEGYLNYKWKKLDDKKGRFYEKVSYVKGYKDWGWIVGTGVYINDIRNKVLISMLSGILPSLIFFVLLIILIRFIMFKSIVEPIDNLADISEKLANNDFNVELPTSTSNTEMGKLYKIFNKFVELFFGERKAAEREALLRIITNKINSTLNIEEIRQEIVNLIGIYFKADRVVLGVYDEKFRKYLMPEGCEFRSSDSIKSFMEVAFEDIPDFNKYIRDVHLKGEDIIFENLETYLTEKKLGGTGIEKFYRDFGFMASVATNINYGDKFLGELVLTFETPRAFSNEEITFLKVIASQFGIAFNNSQLFKKEHEVSRKEILLRKIIETSRNYQDISNIKKQITELVGSFLNADRCYITEYNAKEEKFNIIKEEYLSSEDVMKYSNVNINESFPNFIKLIKKFSPVIVNNGELVNITDDIDISIEKQKMEEYKIKSSMALPLSYNNKLLGILVVHYIRQAHLLTEEDIEFFKIITDQVAMTFYQAQLVNKLNLTTINQNAILNNIPFMAWLKDAKSNLLAVNNAYAQNCHTTREDLIGKTDYDFFPKELAEAYIHEDQIAMETKSTLYSNDLIKVLEGLKWHETFKSPVFNEKGEPIGTVGLSRNIDDEIQLEKSIIENKNLIKTLMDNIPYWTWIKDSENKFIMVNKKLADDIGSTINDFIGKSDYDFFPEELANSYRNDDKKVLTTGKLISVEEKTLINGEARYIETIKLPYINPTGKIIGTMGIAKDITEKKLTEIELMRRQELILQAKEREVLLRNIFEKIRSSLDIDETLTFICEETAKLFNVQRSAITMFPNLEDFSDFIIKKEYKNSPYIKSFKESINPEKIAKIWGETLVKGDKVIAFDNIEESEVPDYFKKGYASMGVKSIIGTPIKKGNDIWGTLTLSEHSGYRSWSEEEKSLLKSIADQVYIAITQSELYEKTKNAAEREKISRNIVEILRSSIDKDIIKKLFVKNIGKFFDADRVFFSEYKAETKMYLPVDESSEYLSNKDQKSFIGYDWSNSNIYEHTKLLLEKREIKIPDIETYLKENPNINNEVLSLYKNSSIKSSYKFPVIYQDKIMGFFCIEFTEKTTNLSEEDIGRIRSICTQAGIAMYHAELYLEAQQCVFSKTEFISDISEKIKNPTNEILEKSTLLSQNEYERQVQLEFLNNIIESCHKLIDLTNY